MIRRSVRHCTAVGPGFPFQTAACLHRDVYTVRRRFLHDGKPAGGHVATQNDSMYQQQGWRRRTCIGRDDDFCSVVEGPLQLQTHVSGTVTNYLRLDWDALLVMIQCEDIFFSVSTSHIVKRVRTIYELVVWSSTRPICRTSRRKNFVQGLILSLIDHLQ